MKKISLSALVLLLLFGACLRDIDDVVITEQTPDPDILENYEPAVRNVTASVTGFVVDEDQEPVSGAVVRLGTESTTTDDFGHFFFKDKIINSLGALVTVEMAGYFNGSRRFFPKPATDNRVKIELLPKVFDQSFNAAAGGTLLIEGGGSLLFSGNTIRNADGTPYTGEVLLAAQWLDPSGMSVLDQMPGNLQGVDVRNEEVSLGSYGMMAVELESPSGEPLNLLDGESAIITMPVPPSMLATAPSEIALWSYSEVHGIWVEEGSATLTGNNYVGQVGHFSFWNCDYPYPLIEFEASFVDQTGAPLVNSLVGITVNGSWTCYSYTDENGVVGGLIPADESMTLTLLNDCQEAIYTQAIGPYSEDVTIGPITVSDSEANSVTISGELLDCDLNPIDNGLLVVTYSGNTNYYYLDGSEFEVDVTVCSATAEVTVTAFDYETLVQSEPVTVQVDQATDLGSITVCESISEDYILIVIGGQTALYTAEIAVDTAGGSYTNISSSGTDPAGSQDFIYFGFGGATVGDYSNDNYFEVILNSALGWQYQGGAFANFTVTTYDASPGGTIAGSFSGPVTQQGVTQSLTGEFRVTRP